MGDDWDSCCPLCMEEMDSTDKQLKPCRCGYQICVWCWNHIIEMAAKDNSEGRCPACRTPYNKEKIEATAYRSVEVIDRKQKSGKLKLKSAEGRKHLNNIRVIQRKLVYVVGIPISLADEEMLEQKEYFGQYGKILKISVSKPTNHSTSASVSVYVTFVKEEDASQCIRSVNGYTLEGKVLKACFGTTKYCNAWLKYMPCNNPECLYLHDEGTREDSFTKEEMLASKSQHFLEFTQSPVQRFGVFLPPPSEISNSATSPAPSIQGSILKSSSATGSFPRSSGLPSAASWGSRSSAIVSGVSSTVKNSSTIASVKSKTGSRLITSADISSAMDSEDLGNGVLVQTLVNNYAPSTNADVAHDDVLRRLARTDSTEPLQTGACLGLQDSDINSEFSIPVLNELIFTSRKADSVDVNPLHGVAVKSQLNSFLNTVSNLAGIEDSVVEKDEEESTRVTASEYNSINFTDVGIPDNHINKARTQKDINISRCDSSSIRIQLLEAEMLDHSSENVMLPNMEIRNSQSDASKMPLATTATAILQVDLASKTFIESSNDNHFTSQTDALHEDPLSESVIVEQSIMTTKNDVQQTCRCLYTDEMPKSMKASHTSEVLVNGHNEHELMSNMFARGFDFWTDGNPQDLVQLLFNGKNADPTYQTSLQDEFPSWMFSESKQSRFHFARQGDATEKALPPNIDFKTSPIDRRVQSQNTLLNDSCASSQVEVSPTEFLQNKGFYAGETFAPPGFSNVRLSTVPPPGFPQRRLQETRRISESSQDCPRSLDVPNICNNAINDVEFIEPAIMAVGRDRQQSDTRSSTLFRGSSLLLGSVPQAAPLIQLSMLIDYDKSHQPIQEYGYSNNNEITSISQKGYSNHDENITLRSSFDSSFSDVMNHEISSGQYRGAQNHWMQDSVYENGTAKLWFQATPWDGWNRVSGVNSTVEHSISEAAGRLAISHMSLDRVIQNRLNELTSYPELGPTYHATDIRIHEHGIFNNAHVGQYYL